MSFELDGYDISILKKLEEDFIKEAESLSKQEFENLKKQKIVKEILVSHSKN